MKQLAIGILAHVDSGKTTLSEALLYQAGAIRRIGRVDHKDAFLDTHSLEKERGITIFSKQAILPIKGGSITLLDTPGHVDFSAEMERTLQVLDYAILVISGTDGVQSHTETLWKLLERYDVPVFLFVNKMDLAGYGKSQVLSQLQKRLSAGCVDFSGDWAEDAAVSDEFLMEEFLENGGISDQSVRQAVFQRRLFPCLFGSALKNQGVSEFLALLERFTAEPYRKPEFGAKVFKISQDEQGARLTHLKITGGKLKVRTLLSGGEEENRWEEKINQIRLYSGSKYHTAEEQSAGAVCAVTGLSHTYPGQGLGCEEESEGPVLQPVLNYQVLLPEGCDIPTALQKLRRLEEEEPQLQVVWNEALQQIHVQLMGEVQLQILKSILAERFDLEVSFGQGAILYRETITAPVEGMGHFEPLRHYAEVHLLLEPLPRGAGLQFDSAVHVDDLALNWQRLILTHLYEKTHLGVLTGSPITDMKITLIDGRAHLKHTEGGDFRQATYRAVRQGLRSAKSILLEPWYEFSLEVPQQNVGRAMSDLQRMQADFAPPETLGETALLTGTVPVATIRDYQTQVVSYTGGRGRLSCTPIGYRECHNAEAVIAEIGYDCDGDLENTADSVFCSHGAGHTVRWDEAAEHMHLEPGKWKEKAVHPKEEQEAAEPEAVYDRRSSGADYVAIMAQDKELMAIFERTYGPIDRDPRLAFETVKKRRPPEKTSVRRVTPKYKGPDYLLVDGYNIIFAWEDLSEMAKENIDAARNQLINILCNYQGFARCELILVFDAYKVKGNPGTVEKVHNIHVVYTQEAETADMYIEKVTHQLMKKHRVRVATSDALEQMIILGHGALRISAAAFKAEVDGVVRSIREYLSEEE